MRLPPSATASVSSRRARCASSSPGSAGARRRHWSGFRARPLAPGASEPSFCKGREEGVGGGLGWGCVGDARCERQTAGAKEGQGRRRGRQGAAGRRGGDMARDGSSVCGECGGVM